MNPRKEVAKDKDELLEDLLTIAKQPSDERNTICLALAYLIVELVPDDRTTKHILHISTRLHLSKRLKSDGEKREKLAGS
jgi:hypothetical protein